jgi:hypothetical protein
MRGEQQAAPAEQPAPFAVVQTLRTQLLPGMVPAPKPANANFAAGGTLILGPEAADAERRGQPEMPSLDQTQHFSAEQLLARRADLEQRLNSELYRELDLLSELEAPPPDKKRFNAKRVLRSALMLALLGGSAYLFTLPPAESAPANAPARASAAAATSSRPLEAPRAMALPADVPVDSRVTLQRAAADVVAQGRYPEALVLYRRLREQEPNNKAYAEIVRILEERLRMR